MTVGGRTSCVVPSVQKKTGPVAGDVKSEATEEVNGDGVEQKPKTGKRKSKVEEEDESEENRKAEKTPSKKRKKDVKQEPGEPAVVNGDVEVEVDKQSAGKKKKPNNKTPTKKDGPSKSAKPETAATDSNRRRSARVSGKGV